MPAKSEEKVITPEDIPDYIDNGKRKMIFTPGITGANFPCETREEIQTILNRYATKENIGNFKISDLSGQSRVDVRICIQGVDVRINPLFYLTILIALCIIILQLRKSLDLG